MPSSWMFPPDCGDGVCRAMSTSGDVSIGVDIGGTFTDVVVRRPGARTRIMKIPSTRKDPSVAVFEALKQMEAEWALPPQEVARFVHGTTVATNAVLERKGACIGLITTQGFRDVLEIGRQMRHQMYDLALDPETPTFLAPGRLRREIRERISATGEVLQALDEAAVTAAADELVSAGAEAIAVVFLFSFLNNSHERRAREIIAARHPHVFVSLSRPRSIRPSANTNALSSRRLMPMLNPWSTAISPIWIPASSPRRSAHPFRSCNRAAEFAPRPRRGCGRFGFSSPVRLPA